MDDNNSTPEPEDISSKSITRRLSYPIRELPYFTDTFAPTVYTELGVNAYHSKEQIAKVMNLEVASVKQLLSSAQQYGLLEIKHGIGYKITPLFIKIHKPVNDNEKREGIIESLKSCDLFNKLITDFNGHVITKNSITNTIIRTYDVKDTSAEKAAEVFIANLKEYQLLASDGSINFKKEPQPIETKVASPTEPETPLSNKGNTSNGHGEAEEGITVIPIPLKSSNKKAYLHIPDGYTDEDLARISKFVDALK